MDYLLLRETPLFREIAEEDIEKMTSCLHFRFRTYHKGDTILRCGSTVTELGLVLSGSVRIENTDFWGDKSLLSVVESGGVFAESYACLPNQPLAVDVIANEDCWILLADASHLLRPCKQPCFCHAALVNNLLTICARKNVSLSERIFDTAAKTIRGRLISYFSRVAMQQNSSCITIPFDRQQLADYLGVDRSAMSRELGKMKKDGLVEFDRSHKNRFICRMDQ